MKKLYTFLLTVACLLSAGCAKQADGGANGPVDPLKNFNWKTTKTVPVNIVAENNEETRIYIYNGTELVAAGYTPFSENITVPQTCTQLRAVPGPLPISYYLNQGRSPAVEESSIDVVTFRAGDASQIRVSLPDEGHKYLYKEWEQTHKGGHSYQSYFVGWWNDSPSGGRVLYGITLYADQEPEYDGNGKLINIPHTCKTADCPDYESDGNVGGEEDGEYASFPTKGTYIFEDLFPYMGDYDMNDFVVSENKNTDVWPNNKVKSVRLKYTVNAAGSSKAIALAVRLSGLKQHDVETVTMQKLGENGQAAPYECTNSTNLFKLTNVKIEELSNNNEVVIPIFENFFDLLPPSAIGYGFNTSNTPQGGKGEPVTFIIDIKFDKNSRNIKLSEFGTEVFIMTRAADATDITSHRGNEIHIADAGYTSKMNTDLFNTGDDASESQTKCFRTSKGYVWGIYLPADYFDHALESVNISEAYPKFNKWIETSGQDILYQNWFKVGEYGKTWATRQQ